VIDVGAAPRHLPVVKRHGRRAAPRNSRGRRLLAGRALIPVVLAPLETLKLLTPFPAFLFLFACATSGHAERFPHTPMITPAVHSCCRSLALLNNATISAFGGVLEVNRTIRRPGRPRDRLHGRHRSDAASAMATTQRRGGADAGRSLCPEQRRRMSTPAITTTLRGYRCRSTEAGLMETGHAAV
jgi:hypothetical protein